MKKAISIILIICLALSFAGCGAKNGTESSTGDSESASSLKIVTTVFAIYDWVKAVTGSSANITYLEGSGSDLHSFEPTAKDIAALSEADVFFYIGGTSDEWVKNALSSSKNSSLTSIPLMDTITALEEETVEGMEPEQEEESGTEYDEHIWLSLKNAVKCVTKISDVLSKKDSANAEKYKKNSSNYISSLEDLDRQYSQTVSSAKRNVLLFADRFPFRYLTEDYGLEYYAAFKGCSAESEASFKTITFLINKTDSLNLPYIIVLENSDETIAESVKSKTGADILTLNSCQSVSDEDIGKGETYLKIMNSNLEVLRKALN